MDVVKVTKDLIKIDTRNPPGLTTEAVEYLQNLFSSFKTKVYSKENGKENLVVEISRGKPTIMLTSHLDTVPSEDMLLNPVIVDGKLYGRGSCDAKGCVAAICKAGLELADSVELGLKLAFTADEEIGGVNGLGFVFPREKSDLVLIGEPTGSCKVGVLQAAVFALDIEISGESGHTATKDAKDGAIYKASEYIISTLEKFKHVKGEFKKYKTIFEELGYGFLVRGCGDAVFNPAIIKGGIKRNVVAPRCTIKADVRFAPWVNVNEIRDALFDDRIESIKVEGFLRPYGVNFDNVDFKKDLKVLEILKKAIERENMEPKAVFSLGVGDSRHVRKFGIPAFYLGPGGENLHSENEYVYISELYTASQVYCNFVRIFSREVAEL
ncbi:MAG: M20 family peptidase [Thaumarchaeota archaeon]|nr:MAG: M20 family peptidase [Nitrososphaerota archaeon]